VIALLCLTFLLHTRRLDGGTTAIVVLISEAAIDRAKWRRRLESTTFSTPTHIYIELSLQLFFHCTAHLVVMIHDPLLVSFLGDTVDIVLESSIRFPTACSCFFRQAICALFLPWVKIGYCYVDSCIGQHDLNLVSFPLEQKLVPR
jgi:hypothetical protein